MHFEIPVRVYIEDTDAGGIVFYAVKSLRRTRVIFEQEARRQSDGALLVHAEVEVVAVTMDTLKPRAMPEPLMNTLTMTIEKTDV